jgi:hypothetical protein
MRHDRAGVAAVAVPGIDLGDVSNDEGDHSVDGDPHRAENEPSTGK